MLVVLLVVVFLQLLPLTQEGTLSQPLEQASEGLELANATTSAWAFLICDESSSARAQNDSHVQPLLYSYLAYKLDTCHFICLSQL